jgi:hypothetical protein
MRAGKVATIGLSHAPADRGVRTLGSKLLKVPQESAGHGSRERVLEKRRRYIMVKRNQVNSSTVFILIYSHCDFPPPWANVSPKAAMNRRTPKNETAETGNSLHERRRK